MSKENEDFEKLFTEIVSSNDLNEISENYEANVNKSTIKKGSHCEPF